jgi:ubiquinone/menaquinone biosynthesis C-methylase UbiE
LPGGIVTAGEVMIEALADSGLKLAEAVQIVAVTRFGTVGFAAALGLLLWVVGWRYARAAVMASDARTQAHFDDLAGEYIDEIPDHIRDRLVARKIDGMCRSLAAHGFGEGARGLDLGCGQGWYALALSQRGFQMTGCDPSIGQVCAAQEFAAAQNAELDIFHAGGESLPFADASFDFVYCINVMHHVTGRSAKTRVLSEIRRVLKPGGVFFMHEMNVRNPLFRLYMSYLFPLIKRIDDGTEVWIPPHQLPPVPGASWSPDVWYFTFLPDFLPRQVMRLLEPIEKRLEQSVMCVWSAHYMARLVKESS